jgi:hypothetical protein
MFAEEAPEPEQPVELAAAQHTVGIVAFEAAAVVVPAVGNIAPVGQLSHSVGLGSGMSSLDWKFES